MRRLRYAPPPYISIRFHRFLTQGISVLQPPADKNLPANHRQTRMFANSGTSFCFQKLAIIKITGCNFYYISQRIPTRIAARPSYQSTGSMSPTPSFSHEPFTFAPSRFKASCPSPKCLNGSMLYTN